MTPPVLFRRHIMTNTTLDHFKPADFSRDNEAPDQEFYVKPRFVNHLDSTALQTVKDLYARLIPKKAKILDLMSGPVSHLRPELDPDLVTGLGMNMEELEANPVLNDRVVHDLNADSVLPFPDDFFDAVVNTVSVDYMVKPLEVFAEVGRILRPKGLFIVIFSNRMFPPKAVNIWKFTKETARVELVKRFFKLSGKFSIEGYTESKGKPRPEDDKYFHLGIPSDPIYAVWGSATK